MRDNKWVRRLAYITGLVNQRLLLQNEYLIAENRILRSHLPTRLCLSDPERSTLVEIGKRLGRRDAQQLASVALPDTIMAWYRRSTDMARLGHLLRAILRPTGDASCHFRRHHAPPNG